MPSGIMCVVPWCCVFPGRVLVRPQQVGVLLLLLLLLLLLVQILAGSSSWTCKQRKVRQQRQSWGAAAGSCLQQVCLAHNPHQFLADQIVFCTSTIAKLFRNDHLSFKLVKLFKLFA